VVSGTGVPPVLIHLKMGFTTNQPFLDSPMAMETHKDLTCWPVKKTAHDSPPLSKRGTQVSQLKYVEIIEK